MILLICVCYYCLAIIGCFFRYYFKKFSESDYRYNHSLNLKRIFYVIYCYFIMAYSVFLILLIKNEIIMSISVLISVVIILVINVFFSGSLEFAVNSNRKKKRKWK